MGGAASAASYTFKRDASGDWADAANWEPAGVPGSDDEATIKHARVTVSKATTIGTITIDGSTTLDAKGVLTVRRRGSHTGGEVWGTLVVAAGATLAISEHWAKRLRGRIENHGTVTLACGGVVFQGVAGAAIDNRGVFELLDDTSLSFFTEGAPPVFSNTGTLRKTGGATTTIDFAFENRGTLDVQTGDIVFERGAAWGGGGVMGAGRAVQKRGVATLDGTVNVQGTLEVSATAEMRGAAGSSIEGGGRVVWSSGNFTGDVGVGVGGRLAIAGSGEKWLNGTLRNAGTVVLAGGGQLDGAAEARIENDGTFEIGDDTIFLSAVQNSPARFVNRGTIKKTGGAETAFDFVLENRGTLEVATGKVVFKRFQHKMGGAAILGAGRVVNNATIELDGTVVVQGTFENAATASLSGDGQFAGAGSILFSGGTLAGRLAIAAGATLLVTGRDTKVLAASVENDGTFVVAGGGDVSLRDESSVVNRGLFEVRDGTTFSWWSGGTRPTFQNIGTLRKAAGTATGSASIPWTLVQSGTLDLRGGQLAVGGGITQTAGFTLLDDATLATGPRFVVEGGTVAGTGIIGAALVNAGVVRPGLPGKPGTLTIRSTYEQSATGTLTIAVKNADGKVVNSDLVVQGPAKIDGALRVTREGGTTTGDASVVGLRSQSLSGTFAAMNARLPDGRDAVQVKYGESDVSVALYVVEPGRPRIVFDLVGRETLRVGVDQAFDIAISNLGDVAGNGVVILRGLAADAVARIEAPLVTLDGKKTSLEELGFSRVFGDERIVTLPARSIAPGSNDVIRVWVNARSGGDFDLRVLWLGE